MYGVPLFLVRRGPLLRCGASVGGARRRISSAAGLLRGSGRAASSMLILRRFAVSLESARMYPPGETKISTSGAC